jgi:hypothetical protein
MAEELIFRIKVEDQEAASRLQQIETELGQLNDRQKELSQTNQKASKEYQENAITVKTLRKEQNDLRNTVIKTDAAQKGNIKTLSGVSKELAVLRGKIKDAEIGSKDFNTMSARIKELEQVQRDANEQMGRGTTFVGEYSKGIQDAFGKLGLFNNQLVSSVKTFAAMPAKIAATSTATGVLTKGLKLLKIALVSTGIGAIVVLLGSLISYFMNTQRGADKLKKAIDTLRAGFDVLKDRLSSIGEAFSMMLSGNFKEGFAAFKNAFKGIGEEIRNETKAAGDLTAQLQKLRDEEIAFITVQAKKEQQIERLRLLSKDENLATEERLKLLKQAVAIEQQLSNQEVEFAQRRADIAAQQLDLAESTADEIKEVEELKADAIRAETESLKLQRTLQSEILGLANQLGISYKAQQDAFEKTNEMGQQFFDDLVAKTVEKKDLTEQFLNEEIAIIEQGFATEEDLVNNRWEMYQADADRQKELQMQKLDDVLAFADLAGGIFENLLDNQNESSKEALKKSLIDTISFIQRFLIAKIAQSTANEIGTKGIPVGIITAGIAAGAISLAGAGLKRLVSGFATGGQIDSGMPVKRSNGDDVLITAKKGEVILNKSQQMRAGGSDFFRSIGVPGFADGGLIGGMPSNLQQVSPNTITDAVTRAIKKIPVELNINEVISSMNERKQIEIYGNV